MAWADSEHDPALAPLHAAASNYRIALGPRAGQKVLTWKDPALALPSQKAQDRTPGCVSAQKKSDELTVCLPSSGLIVTWS